jgi:hypothetical protein
MISFDDVVQLDFDYMNRKSLRSDAKVRLLTKREILMCGSQQ